MKCICRVDKIISLKHTICHSFQCHYSAIFWSLNNYTLLKCVFYRVQLSNQSYITVRTLAQMKVVPKINIQVMIVAPSLDQWAFILYWNAHFISFSTVISLISRRIQLCRWKHFQTSTFIHVTSLATSLDHWTIIHYWNAFFTCVSVVIGCISYAYTGAYKNSPQNQYPTDRCE